MASAGNRTDPQGNVYDWRKDWRKGDEVQIP